MQKQGPGTHWYEHKDACHQHISKYISMHINKRLQATPRGEADLQKLNLYIIQSWSYKKDEVEQSMKHYWPFRIGLAIIDGIAMMGRRIIIPFLLQRQILEQLHSNHMGIENARLLVRESVYFVKMNADIENIIMHCAKCLEYQQTQPYEKTVPYIVPCKPWEWLVLISFC